MSEDDTPRVWLFDDRSDEPRLGLLVDKNGVAALNLWSGESDAAVSLHVRPDGALSLGFWHNDENKPRIGLRVNADGTVTLIPEQPAVKPSP